MNKSNIRIDKNPNQIKGFNSVVKRVYFNDDLKKDLEEFCGLFNFVPKTKRNIEQMLYDLTFINKKHGTDYKILHFFNIY